MEENEDAPVYMKHQLLFAPTHSSYLLGAHGITSLAIWWSLFCGLKSAYLTFPNGRVRLPSNTIYQCVSCGFRLQRPFAGCIGTAGWFPSSAHIGGNLLAIYVASGKAGLEAKDSHLLVSAGQSAEMSPRFPSVAPQSNLPVINASGKKREGANETQKNKSKWERRRHKEK